MKTLSVRLSLPNHSSILVCYRKPNYFVYKDIVLLEYFIVLDLRENYNTCSMAFYCYVYNYLYTREQTLTNSKQNICIQLKFHPLPYLCLDAWDPGVWVEVEICQNQWSHRYIQTPVNTQKQHSVNTQGIWSTRRKWINQYKSNIHLESKEIQYCYNKHVEKEFNLMILDMEKSTRVVNHAHFKIWREKGSI
mgnify:CR=1 FL=1